MLFVKLRTTIEISDHICVYKPYFLEYNFLNSTIETYVLTKITNISNSAS